MKLKALKSFIGKKVSMNIGDIKEVLDENIANDLIRVGYAVEINEKATKKEIKEETPVQEKTTGEVKKVVKKKRK